MKKLKILKVTGVISVILISVAINAQENLVSNGGFEDGIETVWELIVSEGGDGEYTLNTTDPHSGNNCLQADINTLGSNSWSVQIKNLGWSVTEGSEYEASIWMKSATAGSTVNYTIGKATADYTEYATSYGLALTTTWTKYTLSFESSVTTSDDITLAMHITGTDTYFFDDFEVHEVITQILSASVTSSGLQVYLDFSPILQDPVNEQLPFFVYNQNDELKTVDTVRIHSVDPKRIIIDLEEPVYEGETITVEYVPGTLVTETGDDILPFIIDATNSSVQSRPEAIKDNALSGITIYPNPTDKTLYLEIPGSLDELTYEIVDLSGRTLEKKTQLTGSRVEINTGILSKGFYFIVISDNDNHTFVHKFIKK